MIINDILTPPKAGEIIEGETVGIGSSGLFVDLGAFGTGIIYKKELQKTKDDLKNFKIGNKIFAKIMELKNEDGYCELSLAEAQEELAWAELEKIKEKDQTLKIKISKANRGGLIAETLHVSGFLPLSQLSSDHYPRVEGGDSAKILQELQKLVSQTLEVKIFDLDSRQKKLIFSEKAKEIQNLKEIVKKYNPNEIVEGEITGITDFGVFVKFSAKDSQRKSRGTTENPTDEVSAEKHPKQLEGLIHISEIEPQTITSSDGSSALAEGEAASFGSSALAEGEAASYDGKACQTKRKSSPSELFKIGQKIKARIIKIADDRIYLSLKNLKEENSKNNPNSSVS